MCNYLLPTYLLGNGVTLDHRLRQYVTRCQSLSHALLIGSDQLHASWKAAAYTSFTRAQFQTGPSQAEPSRAEPARASKASQLLFTRCVEKSEPAAIVGMFLRAHASYVVCRDTAHPFVRSLGLPDPCKRTILNRRYMGLGGRG